MTIVCRCEHCDALLSTSTNDRHRVQCSHCGRMTVIPEALASLPHPILPDGGRADRIDLRQCLDGDDAAARPADGRVTKALAGSVPWVLSIFVHVAVGLVLAMVALLVMPTANGQSVPLPNIKMAAEILPIIPSKDEPIPPVGPLGEPGTGGEPKRPLKPRKSPSVGEPGDARPLIGLGLPIGNEARFGPKGPSIGPGGDGLFHRSPSGGTMKDVVFVIDRSGSMASTFDVVVDEMVMSIARMDWQRGQCFHIVLFSENEAVELAPARLVPATRANKLMAADFLSDITTTGQTDPLPAISRAFEVLAAGKGRQGKLIFLLTDGVFPDNAKVLAAIDRLNAGKGVCINTILFGRRPGQAEAVLKRIATGSGGSFKHVSPDEYH
ncbi:hypothetical protein LCGC14_0486310 [marine sediment metagenome]|uniref:VWFA domain-containing protein n=1 Tax=marine sediment metagenome TaxID=412755 RepID=A0A0F9S7Q2_9ZZZZ|nr:VWA domain-containing protein [Phycisphaerae bacterium]HDZ42504.1 VWA domain-containing protein [Phycisphaerae bacterium]